MLETLNCNACGAPIEVTSSANFIHCNHCNTNLKIHRTASATFTESVDRLTNTTERLSDQVEKLTRQNELEALDRKWQNERASMMFRDKHGNMHVPSKMGAAGSVVGVAVGILWTIMAIAITQSAPNVGPFAVAKVIFPLFGVVFTGRFQAF